MFNYLFIDSLKNLSAMDDSQNIKRQDVAASMKSGDSYGR